MTKITPATPRAEKLRRIGILWKLEGVPYTEAPDELGHQHPKTVRHWARRYGFIRHRGVSRYSHGPCAGCGEGPYPVERLSEARKCASCRQKAPIRRNPPGWRPMADMQRERRLHRQRMAERADPEHPRPPLPAPCYVVGSHGAPVRMRHR